MKPWRPCNLLFFIALMLAGTDSLSAQAAPASATMLSWLSNPVNVDSGVWSVLSKGLPADFLASMGDPELVATLLMPKGQTFLDSPAVQKALAAPKDIGPQMLATVLKAHMILGEALSESDVQSIHFGWVKESAAGTDLMFTHGDIFKPYPRSVTFVNGVQVVERGISAYKSYVHILAGPLPVDLNAFFAPKPPSPQPSPRPFVGSSSLLMWLSDSANADPEVFDVLRTGLPADFLATLADKKTVATLFLPKGKTFLDSPAVQKALAAPKDIGPQMLATVLKAHMILGEALSESDVQSIHFGWVKESAAGTDLMFTHGDIFKLHPRSITFVNGVKVVKRGISAYKSYVHVLAGPLPVDLNAFFAPKPPSSQPPA